MSVSLNGTNGLTFADSTTQNTGGYTGFRNRIVNGAMMIDQRNAGASVTPVTDTYTLDRWLLRQPTAIYSAQQQSGITPANFSSSLKLSVASPQGVIAASTVNNLTQYIEGLNIADFGWGTPGAYSATLSFWVRSSVTGTYSTAVYNSTFTRGYVATYIINAANTWEYKTVTISGDTSGTWLTNNNTGIAITFDLGSGSTYYGSAGTWGSGALRTSGSVSLSTNSGATFYVTGVQLEKGSVATPFEFRPYGTELQLCQRYYQAVSGARVSIYADSTAGFDAQQFFKVTMRSAPTISFTGTYTNLTSAASGNITTDSWNFTFNRTSGTGFTRADPLSWTASSEL